MITTRKVHEQFMQTVSKIHGVQLSDNMFHCKGKLSFCWYGEKKIGDCIRNDTKVIKLYQLFQ
jgi:hypothetical protein